ncbi:hypothetical protein GUJ93_ZPchr0005g15279 [Zizania palustris]|uniref:Uncharacterized protein n=1 Tax=Zizania palustris TaxID=103762 RepID=A0A8J5SPE8_ZIZPA|nr:hypothetical protein GUJ93_ZPchr0005g15279 [Zizania palustris]
MRVAYPTLEPTLRSLEGPSSSPFSFPNPPNPDGKVQSLRLPESCFVQSLIDPRQAPVSWIGVAGNSLRWKPSY